MTGTTNNVIGNTNINTGGTNGTGTTTIGSTTSGAVNITASNNVNVNTTGTAATTIGSTTGGVVSITANSNVNINTTGTAATTIGSTTGGVVNITGSTVTAVNANNDGLTVNSRTAAGGLAGLTSLTGNTRLTATVANNGLSVDGTSLTALVPITGTNANAVNGLTVNQTNGSTLTGGNQSAAADRANYTGASVAFSSPAALGVIGDPGVQALTIVPSTAQVSVNNTNARLVNNLGVGVDVSSVQVPATRTQAAYTSTQTVISGGGGSSTGNVNYLRIDNGGATFGSAGLANGIATSVPIQVHGVADGTSYYDAVNYGQLKRLETVLSRGIASTTAMLNIPSLDTDKTFSMGVGFGYYNGQNALAAGANYRIADNALLRASVGSAGSHSAIGVGASLAW